MPRPDEDRRYIPFLPVERSQVRCKTRPGVTPRTTARALPGHFDGNYLHRSTIIMLMRTHDQGLNWILHSTDNCHLHFKTYREGLDG